MITIRTSRHQPDRLFWLADPSHPLSWLTTRHVGDDVVGASWLPSPDIDTQPALLIRKTDLPRIAKAIDTANADGITTLKALRALLDAVETPDPRPGPTTRPNTSSGTETAFQGQYGAITSTNPEPDATAPDSRVAHTTPPGATP